MSKCMLNYKDHVCFQEDGIDILLKKIYIFMWNMTKNPGHNCGLNPKLKNHYNLPLHLTPPCTHPGPLNTSPEFPCAHQQPRLPTGSFSVKWPAAFHLVLSLVDFTSLPACKIIQIRQAHHPQRTRDNPAVWLFLSLPPVASTGSFSSPGSSPVILGGCV